MKRSLIAGNSAAPTIVHISTVVPSLHPLKTDTVVSGPSIARSMSMGLDATAGNWQRSIAAHAPAERSCDGYSLPFQKPPLYLKMNGRVPPIQGRSRPLFGRAVFARHEGFRCIVQPVGCQAVFGSLPGNM